MHSHEGSLVLLLGLCVGYSLCLECSSLPSFPNSLTPLGLLRHHFPWEACVNLSPKN